MEMSGGVAMANGRERKRLCVELDPLPTDRYVRWGLQGSAQRWASSPVDSMDSMRRHAKTGGGEGGWCTHEHGCMQDCESLFPPTPHSLSLSPSPAPSLLPPLFLQGEMDQSGRHADYAAARKPRRDLCSQGPTHTALGLPWL